MEMKHETPAGGPVLLYDGVCGFCNKTVQMILEHDRRGTMRFAALQSDYGRAVVERHPPLKNIDSMIYVESPGDAARERVFTRSTAALRVVSYLGGVWKLALVGSLLPRRLRDFLYDQFARRRYRMFGRYESCLLPPENVRRRFLDAPEPTSTP
jgi:predicted DCC family thiol-disulfide oxidoreductase YuxK